MFRFFRVVRFGIRDPASRDIVITTLAVLGVGTVFYRLVEKWSVLDSLYFSVVTLATVGYGDLSPQTGLGRAFTSIFILTGIGIIVAFASTYLELSRRLRDQSTENHAEGGK